MQDLNQSPIDLDEQVVIDSENSQNEHEESQGQECQTFKGSFLLQMQKLTRPLIYQKDRYSIYSLEYQPSDDQILCFVEKEIESDPFTLNCSEEEIEQYVLDFKEESQMECSCKCHEKKKDDDFKLIRRNSESTLFGRELSQKLTVNDKDDAKPRMNLKKWTSISLKEYKQHIKKKIHEKR